MKEVVDSSGRGGGGGGGWKWWWKGEGVVWQHDVTWRRQGVVSCGNTL